MTSYDSWSWNDVPSAQVKLYRSQKETAQNCSCQGSNTCCSTLRSPENWNHSRPSRHYMPQHVAWIWAFGVAADSSKPPILIVPAYWIGPGTKGSCFCMVKCSLATSGPSEKPIEQYEQYENMNTLALWELSCQLCRLHLWFFFGCGQGGQGSRSSPMKFACHPLPRTLTRRGLNNGSPVAQKSLGTEFFYRCTKLYHSKILEMYRYVPSWKCWGAVNCCHIEQKPRDLYSTRDRSRPAHFR